MRVYVHVNMCLSVCYNCMASGIYTDSLSHYARHFCSSYRKRYSPTISIPCHFCILSFSFSLSLSLSLSLSFSLSFSSLLFLHVLSPCPRDKWKASATRSKFWWIYGISNSYQRKRIWPLFGQMGKGRACRG